MLETIKKIYKQINTAYFNHLETYEKKADEIREKAIQDLYALALDETPDDYSMNPVNKPNKGTYIDFLVNFIK